MYCNEVDKRKLDFFEKLLFAFFPLNAVHVQLDNITSTLCVCHNKELRKEDFPLCLRNRSAQPYLRQAHKSSVKG